MKHLSLAALPWFMTDNVTRGYLINGSGWKAKSKMPELDCRQPRIPFRIGTGASGKLGSQNILEMEVKDCSDFKTQVEMHQFFDSQGLPMSGKRHRLDRDGDGVPCEGLPLINIPQNFYTF